jgi:oligo-1,6-glucosidase
MENSGSEADTDRLQCLMIEKDDLLRNHDNPRAVTWFTDDSDEYRELGAKLPCMGHMTLGGRMYIYQGEELGMRNVLLNQPIEESKDVKALNRWKR